MNGQAQQTIPHTCSARRPALRRQRRHPAAAEQCGDNDGIPPSQPSPPPPAAAAVGCKVPPKYHPTPGTAVEANRWLREWLTSTECAGHYPKRPHTRVENL